MQNGALLDREALATVVLRVVATDKAPENNRHQSSIPVGWSISLCICHFLLCFIVGALVYAPWDSLKVTMQQRDPFSLYSYSASFFGSSIDLTLPSCLSQGFMYTILYTLIV